MTPGDNHTEEAWRGAVGRKRLKAISVVYALVPGLWAAEEVFSSTATRISTFNVYSSIWSPSWKSMARLALPSRLELKRPEGSSNEVPFRIA